MSKDLYAVRSKGRNVDGEYVWYGHSDYEPFDKEIFDVSGNAPSPSYDKRPVNNNIVRYCMPLDLAKKHLTAFRELVKVESK